LANLDTLHARAADLVREGERRFDLVLVRAVGRMDVLLAETAPLLGQRGAAVFYKTAHIEPAEMDAAAAAARKLRLKMDVHRLDLPLEKTSADTPAEVLARQLVRFGR
jgi:16S rRNA G527 N7-methylase RsmG